MNKYFLTIPLTIVSISAFGQFNRNSRIETTDTLVSQELILSASPKYKPAEFPGGMEGFFRYVSKKMKFPKDAKSQKSKGKVMVQFVIDSTGNVKKESVKGDTISV